MHLLAKESPFITFVWAIDLPSQILALELQKKSGALWAPLFFCYVIYSSFVVPQPTPKVVSPRR